MKIRDYRNHFTETLMPIYDLAEAESFFYIILENDHHLKRVDLALSPDLEFSGEELQRWNSILQKLKSEIPIQYIIGKTSFYGLEFEVNANTLIPRQETEELVDWIISDNKNKRSLRILDIGTGSGCIAVSLAKNLPDAKVVAIDVSEYALEIAKKNAKHNQIEIEFLLKDILQTSELDQDFDIIVSNPPYVRNLEKAEIRKNVLDNEPHLALFVEDTDALIFYRKIASLAKKNLVKNGLLYFEINQYLGKEMLDLMENQNFQDSQLRKDIYGNDRMLRSKNAD